MTMKMQEVPLVVTQHLMGSAALQALVGDRILGHHPRPADLGSIGYPYVIVHVVGGERDGNRVAQRPLVHIYAYSDQPGIAEQVYDAIYDRLQMERLDAGVGTTIGAVGIGHEGQGPVTGYNDDVGAYYVRAGWVIQVVG